MLKVDITATRCRQHHVEVMITWCKCCWIGVPMLMLKGDITATRCVQRYLHIIIKQQSCYGKGEP